MKKLILTLTLATAALFAQLAGAADGEAVYKKACFLCHDSGAAGAPKKGDSAVWAPRLEKGIDTLVASVVNGLNAMPPKGTCMACSEEELRASVEYMVSLVGGAVASQPAAAPAPAAAVAEPKAEPEPTPTAEVKEEEAKAEAPAVMPATTVTKGDAAAGQAKAALCIACHGPDGNSLNPEWPKIAGQHEDFLYKQLQSFKNGERQNELMSPMAAPLSEQDMRDIAAHFASLKMSEAQGNAELQEAGKRLYTGGNLATGVVACSGCHSSSGAGNPAGGFPRLAGQHAVYLTKALKDYRAGTRDNDLNGMMRGVAAKLSDADIAAVAEYITNLK
ncbi:MAG: hypothetical protein DWQ09_15850 [Proteobacteria bacterium]|nr:MAG: hypothetical protein DWQ09_15850 [Pseudomonadota bacterium]